MGNSNIVGLILSFVIVFTIIGLSELLKKFNLIKDETARKIIHIGVSNWWFLMFYYFDNLYMAIIAPISFIILNYISYKTNLIKSMERSGNGNLGTVYFPIALLLLVIASMTFTEPLVGGIGTLVLGYGDGLAALIGKKFGKKYLVNNKTIAGSITMFLVSLIVTAAMLLFYRQGIIIEHVILISVVVACFATAVELFTPKGLDNLSIPLVVSLVIYVLLRVL